MENASPTSHIVLGVLAVACLGLFAWHKVPLAQPQTATTTLTLSQDALFNDIGGDMVCVTMDWWPTNKCNYGVCPWGNASILQQNLSHPLLVSAFQALDHVKFRIGGWQQDTVVYEQRDPGGPACKAFSPLPPKNSSLFQGGCLSLSRWDQVNHFCGLSECRLIFGLNGKHGRTPQNNLTWDGSNARSLIEYTRSKGFPVYAYELGNELGYNGTVFGKSYVALNRIIEDVYEGSPSKPKIMGSDAISFEDRFTKDFLHDTLPFLHALTWHGYPLGPSYKNKNLEQTMMDPDKRVRFMNTAQHASNLLRSIAKDEGTEIWLGETGGCYNSGRDGASNRFIDAFWYLEMMSAFATTGHSTFCRQTLIGGNYELVDKVSMQPNPDYYGALLFHRLMGDGVLNVTASNPNNKSRFYAHCTKGQETTGSITLVAFNFDADSDLVVEGGSLTSPREEYHMTSGNGSIHSDTVALNGKVLQIDPKTFRLPALKPKAAPPSTNLVIAKHSYAFVVFPLLKHPACGGRTEERAKGKDEHDVVLSVEG